MSADERQYPVDERGQLDAMAEASTRPPKPCCKRIERNNIGASITWCTLADGHAGSCSGPPPRVLEPDEPTKGRRR